MSNPQPPPTNESSFHKANCHCGAVRFTVKLSPPLHEYPVKSCNCSICSRNGYLLVYPNLEDFTLLKGEEKLGEHRFNSKLAKHQFCKDCGSSCFARIDESVNAKFLCVNVRMFEDFDIEGLKFDKFDGKHWKGEYTPQVSE